MQDVSSTIKQILRDLYSAENLELTENTSLRDDVGFDSLDAVEFIMALEDEFALEISDSDAEKFLTIGDVVEYVEKRLDA